MSRETMCVSLWLSVCVCVCARPLRLKVSSTVEDQDLHLVVAATIVTRPCAGTCSAVSSWSNTCSRNNRSRFLPSYNLRVAPCGSCCVITHTHIPVSHSVSSDATFTDASGFCGCCGPLGDTRPARLLLIPRLSSSSEHL